MRKFLLAALVAGLCLIPLQSAEARRRGQPVRVRALTFNIRFDFQNDGQNRWANRVELVAKRIEEVKPMVVCLQEDKEDQISDLQPLLSRFEFHGRGRNATGSGERCSILWDKKTFKAKSKGDFWLSDTPDVVGSNTWGDKYPRKATWALLETRKGKKQLLVINTHLPEGKDGRAQGLRSKGVEVIRAWLNAKLGKKNTTGVMIAGDFNTDAGTEPYTILTGDQELRLRDAWVEAKPADPSPGTFCGWRGLKTQQRIDWLLVGGLVAVRQAGKLDEAMDGRWPSDHYPVFAELEVH